MDFSLFEIANYGSQWWIAICGVHIGEIYLALLHIEHDQGIWKVDFIGLRAVYFWWKYREADC